MSLILLSPVPTRAAGQVTVIVFPPDDLTSTPSLAWLGEGLADSLSQELRTPGVKVIDRDARIQVVEDSDLPPNVALSHASMIRVAQLASADLVVMGSYSGTADKLRIALKVFDLRTMKMSGEISADGEAAALPIIENELAWNILSNKGLNQGLSREEFKARARKAPNAAYSWYIRGLVVPDEAEQARLLEKAVSLYREFPAAQFLLGRYYFHAGDCAKAIRHLELGRSPNQSYNRGDFMLGTCYLESNSLDEAVRSYGNLLSFSRQFEALNNRAVAYLRKGDYDLATQDLIEARGLAPENSTIALNLALLRHLQGNDTAARQVLDEGLEAHPANGMLQFVLSVVLRATGDADGAAAALDKAKAQQVDVARLLPQDQKSWARVFPTMERRPQ